MYCRQCGNEIKETDIYCSNCGAKIELENVESGGAITNIIEDKETKFDRFMKKMFFQNKELTNEVLEQAGKINVIGIVLIQFVAFALLLLFDIEIPSGGITLFWWLFDCYVLKKQGIRGKWKIWGFFIIPVYLCIRATKTNKKYIWAVFSILVCVLGIGGAVVSELYGGTEIGGQNSLSNTVESDRVFNEETYEYTGYVEKDEYVYEDDLDQYKPFSGLYIYQETIQGSENTISYTSAETVEYNEQQGVYFTRKSDIAEDVVNSGFYYVQLLNRETEGLIKYYATTQEADVIVLPTGNSCQTKKTENEYESLEAGIRTYTVTTTAGVFEDCLCMIRTRTQRNADDKYNWSNGTFYTYSYYAPNVGLVLEISRDEGIEFSRTYISKELTAY